MGNDNNNEEPSNPIEEPRKRGMAQENKGEDTKKERRRETT